MFLFQRKCQSSTRASTLKREHKLLSGALPLVTGEKNRQVAELLFTVLHKVSQLYTQAYTKRRICRLKRCWTQRSPRCLPEVLRGSSISFHSNALFVDKSKLMIVEREAFGGKILLTLLRLNLTTEQDTSNCRNDRLL